MVGGGGGGCGVVCALGVTDVEVCGVRDLEDSVLGYYSFYRSLSSNDILMPIAANSLDK